MSPTSRPSMRRWLRAGVALSATALVSLTTLPADADVEAAASDSDKLRAAVTADGVAEHLKAFDAIADANGGTRASGTPGYAASRDYVVDVLREAGYRPRVQAFEFPFFREISPAQLSRVSPDPKAFVNPDDFTVMTYSGAGDVTAEVVPVDTTLTAGASTSGCETSDFAGFPAGSIALIQRGTCPFGVKAVNAEDAGAVGVVIFNSGVSGATGSFAGTLGAPDVTIPVVGASFAMGSELAGSTARLVTHTESEFRTTWNVLAETAKGDPKNVVMAGAHLDSVIAGAGINDNGSGSAALLEVAEKMARSSHLNQVRFSWWGAEELGLLGSEHYVDDLAANDTQTLQAIALYLNFDMIGSPNYVRFVYDGDNSKFPVGTGSAKGPAGSGAIEQMFHDYFGSQDLASAETPFSGRSDYGPFIAQDVPAGGLFTGAEGVKTAEQAAVFGGEAGVAYDVCYHKACDGIGNVNMDAIDEMSDAVAHAVYSYAMSTRSVNGDKKGHPLAPATPGTGTPTGSGTDSGGGLHDDHEHDERLYR